MPAFLALLLGCGPPDAPADSGPRATADAPALAGPPDRPPNVLILLVDDLGLDKVGAWEAHPRPPPTPNIDALVARGLRFDHAYVPPSCSPARAALLTGRHGRRTGIGRVIDIDVDPEGLPLAEVTLAEMLAHAPDDWATLYLGKWHLGVGADPDLETHPNRQGFDSFSGSLDNPSVAYPDIDGLSYTNWVKTVDGASAITGTYATTDTTDEALARIPALSEPWLTVAAYNAIHSPFHLPPEELTPSRPDALGRPNRVKAAKLMTEALDTEIGRLVDGLGPELLSRTLLVFLSDNGSSADTIVPPWDARRAKLTLYDGGCRVPFAVVGPMVAAPGARTDALVHAVDLFPTIAALAGVDLADVVDDAGVPVVLDGASFLPVLDDPAARTRDLLYTERFGPNGAPPWDLLDNRMIRDDRYKLIRQLSGDAFFEYDPARPWTEGANLLPDLTPDQLDAYTRLSDALEVRVDEMSASW